MKIKFYEMNDLNKPSIVVIFAKYNDKIVMCRHEGRSTWEIPGGHIEKNEIPEEAARRELYEETGASKFDMKPVCKYSFESEGKEFFSILYESSITKFTELPNFEISGIKFFEIIPDNVTYPETYQEILKKFKI